MLYLVLEPGDLLDNLLALIPLLWVIVALVHRSVNIIDDAGSCCPSVSHLLDLLRYFAEKTDTMMGHRSRAVGHPNEFLSAVV